MGVQTLVSEQEYLRTSFDGPEPDYIDGQIVERSRPNYDHGYVQGVSFARFWNARDLMPLFPCTELRIRVAPGRNRVVDLAVNAGSAPRERVPAVAPLVAMEIVCDDDAYRDIIDKLEDYRRMGVPNIWLVDPASRRLSVYRDGDLRAVPAFELPEYSFRLTAADILPPAPST